MPLRICTHPVARRVLLGAVFGAAAATSAWAADPTGDWRVADGVATIRVAECQGSMWGAVAWEQIPGARDKNNPDAARQSRPTLGMPILLDMKKQPGAEFWKGVVYNAKDGKSYESTITPLGSDQLKIQGCVLGFLCGGETWTRVGPSIPSSPANAPKGAKMAPPKTATTAPASPATMPRTPGVAKPAGDIGDVCLLPDIPRLAH